MFIDFNAVRQISRREKKSLDEDTSQEEKRKTKTNMSSIYLYAWTHITLWQNHMIKN